MTHQQTEEYESLKERIIADWQHYVTTERAKCADELFPTLPQHVIQINSCEVAFTFPPRAFPYKNISFNELQATLNKEYGFHFKLPDLSALAQIAPNQPQLVGSQVGEFLLQLPQIQMIFENGLLIVPDGRAVSIQSVRFDSESILVKVDGPTRAGEQIIYEILPLLWALAGVSRPWHQLSALHQIAQYGTETRVRLANAALPLLSERFIGILNKWIEPGGLATHMGSRTALTDWLPPKDTSVNYSLDELHILFHSKAPTGFSETRRLRIGIGARHEYGTGVVSIATELPFPEHLDLLQALIQLGRG